MGSWPLEMESVTIGRSASIGVRAHKQKGTPKLENAGAPPPCGVTPKNTLFPTRYLAEFGRSRSNGTCVVNEIRLKI